MDKETCLKAINYYDEAIQTLTAKSLVMKHREDGWHRISERRAQLLKTERDFFIRELQALDAYDVKVTKKEQH